MHFLYLTITIKYNHVEFGKLLKANIVLLQKILALNSTLEGAYKLALTRAAF